MAAGLKPGEYSLERDASRCRCRRRHAYQSAEAPRTTRRASQTNPCFAKTSLPAKNRIAATGPPLGCLGESERLEVYQVSKQAAIWRLHDLAHMSVDPPGAAQLTTRSHKRRIDH